jgi:hypothetical protein
VAVIFEIQVRKAAPLVFFHFDSRDRTIWRGYERGQTESCSSEPSSLSVLVRAAEVTGMG